MSLVSINCSWKKLHSGKSKEASFLALGPKVMMINFFKFNIKMIIMVSGNNLQFMLLCYVQEAL